MKKILLLALIVCSVGLKAQSPVDYDSISATTAPSNAMYGLVFDNATKTIYSMTMDYYQPWLYSGGLLRARSIGDNVIIGSTANTYSDKFFVNGTSTVSGNLFGMGRIYVGAGRSSYIYAVGNQLYFYSPTTGVKSLSQLGTGSGSGGADLTLVPDKSVIVERSDTAYGTTKFTFNDTTLNVQSVAIQTLAIGELAGKNLTSAGTSNTLLGYGAGQNLTSGQANTFIGNSSGWYMTTGTGNTGVGYNACGGGSGLTNTYNIGLGWESGRNVTGDYNISIGVNAGSFNQGSGNIFIGRNAGYASYPYPGHYYYNNQLFIENSGQTRFNTLIWGDFANDSLRLNADVRVKNTLSVNDTIYYLPFAGVEAGKIWWTNSVTGGIDSANTEPAYIGWEMKDLPTLEEYEADVKIINGHMERRVWYIDYETKELKSQYGWSGLGMMNTQSAYMIYHEITVRWMFEQNKKIAELQKVQIPSDVMNITRALNGVIYGVFTLFGLFILLIAFSIAINRK